MGEYTITKDPTRDNGLRILMGPFTVYNKDNVAGGSTQPLTNKAKEITGGTAADMILLPKFMGNQVFEEANQGAEEAAQGTRATAAS